MSSLVDLMHPAAVQLDAEAADWVEAITRAGVLLEETGVATAEYTRAMVDSVHTNGPYIVLAPGFALAHARPSDAVLRTGLSWLRLARPVEFGHRSNDPVEVVVAMAARDAAEHRRAMAHLAGVVSRGEVMARLRTAPDAEAVLAILREATRPAGARAAAAAPPVAPGAPAAGDATSSATDPAGPRTTRDHILTVCGNGVGTSLFLKNTLESVLQKWGWAPYLSVEATDTVSAKGKAGECDLILTSGEIARALGDLGVPMVVIENFTSEREVDAALREVYDI